MHEPGRPEGRPRGSGPTVPASIQGRVMSRAIAAIFRFHGTGAIQCFLDASFGEHRPVARRLLPGTDARRHPGPTTRKSTTCAARARPGRPNTAPCPPDWADGWPPPFLSLLRSVRWRPGPCRRAVRRERCKDSTPCSKPPFSTTIRASPLTLRRLVGDRQGCRGQGLHQALRQPGRGDPGAARLRHRRRHARAHAVPARGDRGPARPEAVDHHRRAATTRST